MSSRFVERNEIFWQRTNQYVQMFSLPRSHETDKFSNELGDMRHHVLSKYVCSEDVDAHGNAGDVILFGWLKSSSLPARLWASSCCML